MCRVQSLPVQRSTTCRQSQLMMTITHSGHCRRRCCWAQCRTPTPSLIQRSLHAIQVCWLSCLSHLSVSPVCLTCLSHLSVSPRTLTPSLIQRSLHAIQVCWLTCLSHLSDSPVCHTCLSHLSDSPVCLSCLSYLVL